MRLIGLAAVVAALVLVPAALADSSTLLNGYGNSGSKPVVQVKGAETQVTAPTKPAATPASTTVASGGATLPFTGADLAVFAAVGAAIVALGFGLRRLGRDD